MQIVEEGKGKPLSAWKDGARREVIVRYVERTDYREEGIGDSLSWKYRIINSEYMIYPDIMMVTKNGKSLSATFHRGDHV